MVRYANGFSSQSDPSAAAEEISQAILKQTLSRPVHLTFVFATADRFERMPEFVAHLQSNLHAEVLLGCTAETLIFQDRELEGESGIVVWSASFEECQLEQFSLNFSRTDEGILCEGFPEPVEGPLENAAIFLLCDPFTTPTEIVLDEFAERFPGVPMFGGMASGFVRPQESQLLYQDQIQERGCVGVLIKKGPPVRSIVSQGCRPIGQTYIITRGQKNLIQSLGGHPVLEKLNQTIEDLADEDRQLLRYGLYVGVVMNEYQDHFEQGDFLIFNALGIDEETGQLALGGRIRTGQTVQFHLRDAASADADLKQLVARDQREHSHDIKAGLLFSCNGRGTKLFDSGHHDAGYLSAQYEQPVLAGFFAQGELGPVGDKNFLHGFTASVALFE